MFHSKFKSMMNELSFHSNILRELTREESESLKQELFKMFKDVLSICEKHKITIMLGGGSALGCVRHQGFIPWDDDLDLMMPRKDYEIFKTIFQEELGKTYILSAPNYHGKSKARFPKIIKKNTTLKELTDIHSDLPSGIFLDIFIIENVPVNTLRRRIKGLWCNVLMFGSTQAFWYEHRSDELKLYMCQTARGKRAYRMKMAIGRFFSMVPSWKWFDAVDKAVQYNKKTELVCLPTGRKHYFGEIHPKDVFLPISHGIFCNIEAPMPGKPDAYLKKIYGESYMELPPENKREKHFIVDFSL